MRRLNVVNEEDVLWFRRRAAMALDNMKRIRREDCPRCTGIASDVGEKCTSKGDPDTEEHGFMDGPMCRWALSEGKRQAEEDATKARASRMTSAGIEDKALVAWLAPLRAPPVPPMGWFGLDQEDRKPVLGLMEDAEGYLSHPECRCFILFGGIGAGKSTAAAWIVAGEKDNALWLPARTVDDLERWKAVSHRAYSTGLLVIDDLGTERASESNWASDTLGSLWTDRLDRGMRTVVTTNLAPADLGKRYGQRLTSRLNLRPLVGFTKIGAVDLRRKKRDYEQRMQGGSSR